LQWRLTVSTHPPMDPDCSFCKSFEVAKSLTSQNALDASRIKIVAQDTRLPRSMPLRAEVLRQCGIQCNRSDSNRIYLL